MSKFYQYINEDIEDYIKKIKQDCGYYLFLLDKNNLGLPFYRGVNNKKLFSHKKVHKNREPKATNAQAFEEINNYFEDKGHVRRDNSVIGTSNYSWVKIFGMPHMLFPIGKFDYTWIEMPDFNRLKTYGTKVGNFMEGKMPDTDEEIEEILKEIEGLIYTNKGIDVAYRRGYEIWFSCEDYYLVNTDDTWDGIDPAEFMSRF